VKSEKGLSVPAGELERRDEFLDAIYFRKNGEAGAAGGTDDAVPLVD